MPELVQDLGCGFGAAYLALHLGYSVDSGIRKQRCPAARARHVPGRIGVRTRAPATSDFDNVASRADRSLDDPVLWSRAT